MADLTLPGAGEPRRGETDSLAALSRLPAVDRLLSTPALVAAAQARGSALTKKAAQAALDAARAAIRGGAEAPPAESLAQDALRRLDLRLSRLLRRARLGRIESVLGKKRALEVEIGAIQNGYLPQDAVDALEPVRYLKDNEEYWPFEGDDWPDEYVGAESLK